MKIKDGGAIQNMTGNKIEIISIVAMSNIKSRNFELWINDSLSFITLDELLNLRDEINDELKKIILPE